MKNPKFQMFTDKANQYRFNLRAANGEIILHSSESYTTRQNCLNGIESVKNNTPDDARYKRRAAVNADYYFVLVAANGEPLGMSEMYTTYSARENGIAAVKRDAPTAPVEDLCD